MSHGDGDVTIRPVTEDPPKSQPIWAAQAPRAAKTSYTIQAGQKRPWMKASIWVVPGVQYQDRWGHIDEDWLARSLEP